MEVEAAVITIKSLDRGLHLAVVGGGYMGVGIAQVFALSGVTVTICDISLPKARAAVARAQQESARYEADGLFPAGSSATISERVRPSRSVADAVVGADFIIEAVTESLAVKHGALRAIGDAAPHDAIVASNTSALPIDDLQTSVASPERFVGAHWMNPAPFVPGVEVIAGPKTSEFTVTAMMEMLTYVGKRPFRVPLEAGSVVNRLQFALFQEAARIVDEGRMLPHEVDDVVTTSFGFRLPFFGPYRGADMIGLDVFLDAYRSLEATFGDRFSPPEQLVRLVERGDLGFKTGEGFTVRSGSALADVVSYRSRAYAALDQLKYELGDDPCRMSPRESGEGRAMT